MSPFALIIGTLLPFVLALFSRIFASNQNFKQSEILAWWELETFLLMAFAIVEISGIFINPLEFLRLSKFLCVNCCPSCESWSRKILGLFEAPNCFSHIDCMCTFLHHAKAASFSLLMSSLLTFCPSEARKNQEFLCYHCLWSHPLYLLEESANHM